MMKFITSIIAFSITFILSVALIGVPTSSYQAHNSHFHCNNQDGLNILSLLQRDISNGNDRSFEIRNVYSNAETMSDVSLSLYARSVEEYVDNSQALNDYGLPADFRSAWREHMQAWRDYSNFLNGMKGSSVSMADSDFLEIERDYNSEINRTWFNTLKIGKQYDRHLYRLIY